jgi:arsenite methyltransferase
MKSDQEKESERLKEIVREKYAQIAREAPEPGSGPSKRKPSSPCCSAETSPCCAPAAGPSLSTYYSEDVAGIKAAYEKLNGHMDEADLGLGCGLPTEHAGLAPGQTVVDLGSGAGNDVFIARSAVGDTGRIIGIDMTPEMIGKARAVDDAAVDVVVSNCVLNLVPDKRRAFAEIFRVLRPGGRFCVSDIVIQGELPAKLRGVAELYVGCVAGALAAEAYLGIINETGFTAIDIKAVKKLDLPDDYMLKYISAEDLAVLSITVVGTKPAV